MTPPNYPLKSVHLYHGKLTVGTDVQWGDNITINVAEELIIGDRAVIPSNAHLEGRRIEIGADFYGYSWEWKRLDVGRGRKDDEHAVFRCGARCTLHDNKIDLAREVTLGDDVGLSPEVAIYTHYYWNNPLNGFPYRYASVEVGAGCLVGFRSTLLPGVRIGPGVVLGAGSVTSGRLMANSVYAGNPAVRLRELRPLEVQADKEQVIAEILEEYRASLAYRGLEGFYVHLTYPEVWCYYRGCVINVETGKLEGEEDQFTDDLREFLFKRGVRIYTKRPFRKLPKGYTP